MASLQTVVRDNEIDGDLALRDIYKTVHLGRTPTSMGRLVAQYIAETQADKTLSEWIEKLSHFLSNETSSDVRGLEDKLIASGREDLLDTALKRKQAAYKAIMRQQGSRSAQTIYTFLLAEIVVNFEQSVLPLVQAGSSREIIDCAMLDKVISPALAALEENPLMLDKLDIQGLVYFLAGNCYIRWDQC